MVKRQEDEVSYQPAKPLACHREPPLGGVAIRGRKYRAVPLDCFVAALLAMTMILSAANAARADGASSNTAISLGEVLGAEDFCGLTYDQAAVKSFMDKNVKKDDADFASLLRMVTGWTKYRDGTMSVADKTDQCSGIEQMARSFGFIR